MSFLILLIQWRNAVCKNFNESKKEEIYRSSFRENRYSLGRSFDHLGKSRILSVLVIVLLHHCLNVAMTFGQIGCSTPSVDWQLSVGGSNDDFVKSVFQTSDGGYVVAGESSSSDASFSSNHGNEDILVIKFDSIGNIQWQKLYGGSKIDNANSIIQTLDGGYAVAGKSNSIDGDVLTSKGGTDYWILKLKPSGDIEWQKSYGGSDEDVPFEIDQTADGGYIVAGHTYSNDGDVTINHGKWDSWVIKLSANGNLKWQKSFGGSMSDATNSVHQTEDGGYILCGNTLSNDGDVTFNHGQEDVWFFKLDANGNLLWQRSMGGSGGDGAKAIDETLDHGMIIVGFTHSFDGDVVGSHGNHEVWVIKADSLGNEEWTRCLGGKSGDDGSDVKQVSDGTYLVGGRTTSNDGDVSGNHGMHDGWIASLDENGTLIWQKCLGGSNDDLFYAFRATSDGNYVVAGQSKSNDGDASSNNGSADSWIVKLKSLGSNLLYADNDRDGYGDSEISITGCMPTSEYVLADGDCNDNNSSVNPNAIDLCNSIDDNCNGEMDENALLPTVNPAGSVAVCRGDMLTLIATSGSGITYQWMKDSKVIPGATNQTYATGSAGSYQVKESNSSGCSGSSIATVITLQDEPSAIINSSGNLDICESGHVVLKANGKSGLTYQWQKGNSMIAGATNKTYTVTTTGTYKVLITNTYGCSNTSPGKKITSSCRDLQVTSIVDQVVVYPNPASNKFTVKVVCENSQGEGILQVIDMVGRIMYEQTLAYLNNEYHQEIALGNSYADGMYIVNVIINDEHNSKNLVVQK